MSQKFSFIIEVTAKGEPKGTAYHRSDAAKAVADFNALRSKGVEAYFFQHPVADKKSKSAVQNKATQDASTPYNVPPEVPVEEVAVVEEKPKKKNALGGF